MSKGKNKKNTSAKKNVTPVKKSKMPLAVTLIAAALTAVAIAVIIILNSNGGNALTGTDWIPSSANNASGDEVELAQIYENNYTTYQGSLSFEDDNKFCLWLSPGDPDDGTHSGKYEIQDDSTVLASFDDGTVTSFYVNRSGDEITSIKINYNNYEIYFIKA